MKKIIHVIAFAALMLAASSVFAASKKSIVCTTYPEYDWVLNILGKNASSFEVTLLQDKGTDLHSYQPSVQDLAKISTCDVFVYVGGESDGWVEDALKNVRNKNMVAINMMEVLGDAVREEEIVEGMQAEGEHEHHHHEAEAHNHSAEIHADDIKDRSLAEFNGEWQSLYPVLMAGNLEEYVEHQAEEKGKSETEMKAEIAAKWNCGVKAVTVKDNKITITYDNGKTVTGKYSYAGYAVKTNDEGKITNVRYKFESKDKKAPKYVMFNDHSYAPAEKVAHFHFYFGNNGFDEFMDSKINSYFVDSKLTAHECEDLLLGHNHDHHAEGHHHEHGEEPEYDEHVWLSLKNAAAITQAISDAVQKLDSKNAGAYKANTEAYLGQLAALDSEYEKAVAQSKAKTLVFGDRFPFRYLVDDYGLKYYAAFVGCSAESEASFETVVFLAKKLDELGLGSVLTIEKSDKKIAKTVVSNTKAKNQQILEMDSLQSVTQKDIKNGKSYLGAMKQNLAVLKTALN